MPASYKSLNVKVRVVKHGKSAGYEMPYSASACIRGSGSSTKSCSNWIDAESAPGATAAALQSLSKQLKAREKLGRRLRLTMR